MKKIVTLVSLVAILSLAVGYFSNPSEASSAKLQLGFTCLWWGPDQMGIDPNDAPPKTTVTSIEKWEYSDPVGVPHPDSVTLVGTGEGSGYLVVERRFKQGHLMKAKTAKWDKWETVAEQNVTLSNKTKLAELDIKTRMDALFKKEHWPYALEARVTLYSDKTKTKKLLTESKTLPITSGD